MLAFTEGLQCGSVSFSRIFVLFSKVFISPVDQLEKKSMTYSS